MRETEAPKVSMAAIQADVDGSDPSPLRLLDLIEYKNHPIQRSLQWLERPMEKRPSVVSAVRRGDASIVYVHGAEAMRSLTLEELRGPWRRPEAGFLTFAPRSKELVATRAISTSNGEEWKRRHSQVNHAMRSRSAVDRFETVMERTASEILSGRERVAPLDPLAFGTEVAVRNTVEILFGSKKSAEHDAMQGHVDRLLRGVMSPLVLAAQVDLPFTPYGRLVRSVRALHDFFEGVALEKLRKHDDSVASLLLHRAKADGSPTELSECLGDMVALFITGRDGPAASIAWTLIMLALHPRWQLEIRSRPSALSAVIHESLRILPPSFVLNPRIAAEDTELGGVRLPRGSMALGSIIYRHRDDGVWGKDAREFRPERWLSGSKPSPMDFLPFGQGPRRCIGDQLAMKQLEITVRSVVERFDIAPSDRADFDYAVDAVLLRPKGCELVLAPAGSLSRERSGKASGRLLRDLIDPC